MQYQNTSAADFPGFLAAVRDFLAANGWTTLVDNVASNILEMTNSNGHDFALTRTSTNVSQWNPDTLAYENIADARLNLQYQKSDIGLAAGYSTAEIVNDMGGPFSNLWLFTDDDGTYCNIVIQTSTYRYAHCSFGDLDPKGAHAIDIPYVSGMYYVWWRDYSTFNTSDSDFNDVDSGQHSIGHFIEGAFRLGLPDGVVDPALGFTDGPVDDAATRNLSQRFNSKSTSDTTTYWLDYFQMSRNQVYTGGVKITPSPVFVEGPSNTITFVGEIGAVGLVNMAGLSAGQILTFATEEWIVFPLKRYGLLENTNGGGNPLPVCNSVNYGFAYRKA